MSYTNIVVVICRVSTHEQNLDHQEDALKTADCKKVYTDKTSGIKAEQPGLEKALANVRPGDSLVVWKLDRLGHSLKHLIEGAPPRGQTEFQVSLKLGLSPAPPQGTGPNTSWR